MPSTPPNQGPSLTPPGSQTRYPVSSPAPTPLLLSIPVLPSPSQTPEPVLNINDASAAASAARPKYRAQYQDYSAYAYPPTRKLLDGTTTVQVPVVGRATLPTTFRPPPQVAVGDTGVTVPTPLGPEYVIFGGAKYASTPPALAPPGQRAGGAAGPSSREAQLAAEVRRLEFVSEQLYLAQRYLRLGNGGAAGGGDADEGGANAEDAASAGAEAAASSPAGAAPAETDDGAPALGKANLCTVAYYGTPRDVYAFLEKHPDARLSGALEAAGYVTYGRRQWGIRKSGEVYGLGLGSKGTPLQFAAVAGRLDNVLVLMTSGARDTERPRLKQLLSETAYESVMDVVKPNRRKHGKKGADASAANEPATEALPVLYATEQVDPHPPQPVQI